MFLQILIFIKVFFYENCFKILISKKIDATDRPEQLHGGRSAERHSGETGRRRAGPAVHHTELQKVRDIRVRPRGHRHCGQLRRLQDCHRAR